MAEAGKVAAMKSPKAVAQTANGQATTQKCAPLQYS
jgi:hypothetical protein